MKWFDRAESALVNIQKTFGTNRCSKLSPKIVCFTLLGSGFEWPKGEALLLTVVSRLKNQIEIKIEKNPVSKNGGLDYQSSQSANFWKIAKMALFNKCMKFNFGWQSAFIGGNKE